MQMNTNHIKSCSLNLKYKGTKEKESDCKLTKLLDKCDWTKATGLDYERLQRWGAIKIVIKTSIFTRLSVLLVDLYRVMMITMVAQDRLGWEGNAKFRFMVLRRKRWWKWIWRGWFKKWGFYMFLSPPQFHLMYIMYYRFNVFSIKVSPGYVESLSSSHTWRRSPFLERAHYCYASDIFESYLWPSGFDTTRRARYIHF